mgnify:CR=1 FL=1
MLTFRPTKSFLVKPKNNQEYNREKNGVIITSSIENAKDVNRFGIIEKTPLFYTGDLKEGDEVVLHHNVFRSYFDIKGNVTSISKIICILCHLIKFILLRKIITGLALMIIVLSLRKPRRIWQFR